jgi:hypothetical protein
MITAGGVGIAKALYVGTNANVAGTLAVTGVATFSATPIYSSLTASSAVATDASKNLVSVTNTGTGNNVLATSPTLVTPILGTPTSGSLVNCTDINYTGFKNRLINSAMVIDQRNAGAAVTMSAAVVYLVDRWWSFEDTDGTMTAQQSSTAPTGFTNSLLCTTTSNDASLGSTQRVVIAQSIEGFNVADLGWGTASAQTVTLSFWVRSSLTGTFGGVVKNSDTNRSYPFNYTINAANTFEQKSVTIAGDTTGTWLTNNGTGIQLNFGLGVGSTYSGTAGAWAAADYNSATGATSVVGTNGATFYITGVQLEKGSTATSFDYRPFGTELALCQRYYWRVVSGVNFAVFAASACDSTTSCIGGTVKLPVTMRAIPTCTVSGVRLYDGTGTPAVNGYGANWSTTDNWSQALTASGGGLTNGRGVVIQANNSSTAYIDASSEL